MDSSQKTAMMIPSTVPVLGSGINTTRRLIGLSKLRRAERLKKLLDIKKGISNDSPAELPDDDGLMTDTQMKDMINKHFDDLNKDDDDFDDITDKLSKAQDSMSDFLASSKDATDTLQSAKELTDEQSSDFDTKGVQQIKDMLDMNKAGGIEDATDAKDTEIGSKIDDIKEKVFNKLRNVGNGEEEEQNSHLNDLMEQANQQQRDIEQSTKGVDDSFNTNEEAPSQDFQPSPKEPTEDLDESIDQPTEETQASDVAEQTSDIGKATQTFEDAENAVSDVSKVAKAGQILEDTAVGDELGGGEFDPIQDIISGALAIGGSIASSLALDSKPKDPPPEPTINVQQGMAGVEA